MDGKETRLFLIDMSIGRLDLKSGRERENGPCFFFFRVNITNVGTLDGAHSANTELQSACIFSGCVSLFPFLMGRRIWKEGGGDGGRRTPFLLLVPFSIDRLMEE